jgi:hypothetical protein
LTAIPRHLQFWELTDEGEAGTAWVEAAEATDPKLKESLQNQAAVLPQAAEKRATELNLPPLNLPPVLPDPPSAD